MAWQEQIKPDSGIWHGVEEYARQRIEQMVQVCTAMGSSDNEIRMAQARIDELQRLISLPQMIAASVSQKNTIDRRQGY